MPSYWEYFCCCEVDFVVQKIQEIGVAKSCITEHEGIEIICLNVWVLQTAYFI